MDKSERILLPSHALAAILALEEKGFEAWCVGGCVRDSILGLVPQDWDVTTNATPDEIKGCFPLGTTVDTGIQHGTITVVLNGVTVEITTYRTDGKYTDSRHPDSVKFSRCLKDDLSRRDFTVNAMAYHPAKGLVDLFGGLEDVNRKCLRCVGQPITRFTEDALRILRCLRFSSALDFIIEDETKRAAESCSELLGLISQERIREELTKLICGNKAAAVLRENAQILLTVLPELAPMTSCAQETKYHCYNVWEHSLHALEAAPGDYIVRWAALLHDCGKPAVKFFSDDKTAHFYGHGKESIRLAEIILKRLRFSNRERENICALIAAHGESLPMSEKRIKRLIGKLGEANFFRLLALMNSDNSAKAPKFQKTGAEYLRQAEDDARQILARGDCLTLRDLEISGKELLSLGYKPNRLLGEVLNALLAEVLDGALPNSRDALLSRAKDMLKMK